MDWSQMSAIYRQLFDGHADGFIDAGPAMFAAERQPNHRLLFLTTGDYQMSAQGQAVVGGVLYDRLAQDRPWAEKR
jgi:hypothetical protein